MCRPFLVLLDFMFDHSVSGGHPSHCRPSPVLLDLFLRMSPLQVITHPCAELAWCCWTSSSAVAFSAVTHPTADRARCCFTFFFDCLLFRRSPIQVLTWPGAAGLHRRLSRFRRSPIPLLTEPGAALPFSTIASSSDCHPSDCLPFLVLLDFMFGSPVFRWSPILLPTEPGAA